MTENEHQRIILYERKRYYKCTKSQHAFAVDRERISAEFFAAVREYVHKFKPVSREEAERGVYYEQSRENLTWGTAIINL